MNRKISRKHAALKQASIGYFRQSIVLINGLVLIPLYLHYIGDRLYGLWLASGGILIWISMFDMGVGAVINQRISYYYGKNNLKNVSKYFINGVLVYSCMIILLVIIGYAISFPLPKWINAENGEVLILRSCFQIAVINIALTIANDILRGFGFSLLRPAFQGISLIFWMLCGLLSTIYMLLNNFGLRSIPIGQFIVQAGALIFNCIYVVIVLRKFGEKLAISWAIVSEYLLLLPSTIVARIGRSLVQRIEPIFITILISPEITIIYVIVRRAADFVAMLIRVILGSTLPGFIHQLGENIGEKTSNSLLIILKTAYFSGLVGFSFYYAINTAFVRLWVGESYYSANLTLLIAVGMFLREMMNFSTDLILGVGKIKLSSLYIFFESISRAILIFLFIDLFGLYGAPIGMIISSGIIFIFSLKSLLKLTNTESYNIKVFSLTLTALVTIIYTSFLVKFTVYIDSWLILIFSSGASLIIYLLIVLLNESARSILSIVLTNIKSIKYL